ncbi:MAG: hypothetical protein SPL42_05955, partial [Bacteroidales bacterium]|nr:hypothetical protein [Bacteroidales bacterium]
NNFTTTLQHGCNAPFTSQRLGSAAAGLGCNLGNTDTDARCCNTLTPLHTPNHVALQRQPVGLATSVARVLTHDVAQPVGLRASRTATISPCPQT